MMILKIILFIVHVLISVYYIYCLYSMPVYRLDLPLAPAVVRYLYFFLVSLWP